MAEYHTTQGVTTSQEIMQMIYDHISNVSCPLAFANDTGTDALYDGTGFGTPTGAAWWGAGSYMVIEGPHPDASVWQYKIERVISTNIQTTAAPNGGWTTAGFGGSLVGAAATTQLGSSIVVVGDSLWCSSSVGEDTYNGGASGVAYFRVLWYDNSLSAYGNGTYVGNFIPLDVTDGKPFVLFRGDPESVSGSGNWGSDSATSNLNEIWGELAQVTLVWGTCQGIPNINTPAIDFNGNYVTGRCHVQAAGANTLGYLGDNALRCMSSSVTASTIATGSDYVAGHGYVHKWAP